MTPARATLAGLAGLMVLVALALSVGAQGFGWGDGGAWALLRAPRVLAALAAAFVCVKFSGPVAMIAGGAVVALVARRRE